MRILSEIRTSSPVSHTFLSRFGFLGHGNEVSDYCSRVQKNKGIIEARRPGQNPGFNRTVRLVCPSSPSMNFRLSDGQHWPRF